MDKVRAFFMPFLAALKDGVRVWWLVPSIPLIAVAGEFAQHVAEINLGMFVSKAAFVEYQLTPERMVWGVLKVATMTLAMLFALRSHYNRDHAQPWWSFKGVIWSAFFISLVFSLIPFLPNLGEGRGLSANAILALSGILFIATLPVMPYGTGALLGDKAMTLKAAFTRHWGTALRMLLYFAMVFAPLQALHMLNHTVAMGSSPWLVWLIMIFDSLLVGLIATLTGMAGYYGYMGRAKPDNDMAAA